MTELALATDFVPPLDANRAGAATLEARLRLAADAGFTHIHWCEDWNNTRLYAAAEMDRIASLVSARSLKCLDVHGAATPEVNLFVEDAEKRVQAAELVRNRVEFCSLAGGDAVVLHGASGEGSKRRVLAAAGLLEELIVFAHARSVRLALENGGAACREALEALFERFAPEALGFCFDSGHARLEGTTETLERHGARLAALHLDDNDGEKDLHRLPFDGTVPWDRVVAGIRAARYEKPLCLEVTCKHYDESLPLEEFVREAHARAERLAGMLDASQEGGA